MVFVGKGEEGLSEGGEGRCRQLQAADPGWRKREWDGCRVQVNPDGLRIYLKAFQMKLEAFQIKLEAVGIFSEAVRMGAGSLWGAGSLAAEKVPAEGGALGGGAA